MKKTTQGAEVLGTKSQQSQSAKPEISNLSIGPKIETPQTPAPPTKVLTVEDRKGRTEVFTKLLEKHENLKDVEHRCEAFAIGSDEHSQTLTLKDSKGNLFNTGNPVLLKEVINLVRSHVVAQVGVVETDILNFII